MANSLSSADLQSILAHIQQNAGNLQYSDDGRVIGGSTNYVSPDGWTYFDARNDGGGSVGRYQTSNYKQNGVTPTELFDPTTGTSQGGSTLDARSSWYNNPLLPFLLVAAPFAATAAGVAAAGTAGAGASFGAVEPAASFGAGAGSGAGGLGATFGAVEPASSFGGGGIIGPSGVGGSGLGLKAGLGTGLDLASTTGGAGFSVAPGAGLTLADTVGTLGLDPAAAGAAVGGGIGTTGFAGGSGTLLGDAALNGTTTLADGTVLPPSTPPGGTPPVTTTPTVPKVPIPPGGGGTGTGSGGTGGFNPMDLLTLLGGAYDMHRQEAMQQKMLDYLNGRQQINDQMYKPGSPEANYMQQQMDAKDAAAGRNSQYGVRADNLAGQLAKLRMDANTQMTTGIANVYSNAINKQGGADAGLLSALGNLSKNGGGVSDWLGQFGKAISSGNWNDFTSWFDAQNQTPKSTVDTSGTTTPDTQDPLTGGAT